VIRELQVVFREASIFLRLLVGAAQNLFGIEPIPALAVHIGVRFYGYSRPTVLRAVDTTRSQWTPPAANWVRALLLPLFDACRPAGD
jgi:hypothetical protein